MTHHEIAEALIGELKSRGLGSFAVESLSGSVYVYIIGSRQKIRIANHRKHRGWFRYNIRSDLRESREFRISGQRVFLFADNNLIRAANLIAKDFKDERRRGEGALVKTRKRRKHRGDEKSRRAKKSAERAE